MRGQRREIYFPKAPEEKAGGDMSRTFDEIRVGDSATHARTITADDIDAYAKLTDDYNPMHMDDEFAKKNTKFGGRIAHGPMTLGLIAPVIGMKLPGPGCLLMSLNSTYLKPVRVGDHVTATGEVAEKDEKRRAVRMALRFVNQHGEEVVRGEAWVLPPKSK
jgi:3-hydroxybutyryl-CoA dehydratase